MISKQFICIYWILSLSVGLSEVTFTPMKEVGIVTIFMSVMGLLREVNITGTTDLSDYDKNPIQTGKY